MVNTPEAAPQGTEASNINLNNEGQSSAVSKVEGGNSNGTGASTPSEATPQAISNQQVAEYFKTTPEQIDAFTRFMDANGKFEKAFAKVKDTISNPQPKAETQTVGMVSEAVDTKQMPPSQQPSIQIPEAPEGYTSMEEEFQIAFRDRMAKQYPELDNDTYIKSGEFLKEAASLGMQVVDQYGRINEKGVRKFLDLKKATIPPAPASSPITSTPTADYVHTEGDITSQETADAIMKQGTSHPRYNEAMQFTRERIFGKKPDAKKSDATK